MCNMKYYCYLTVNSGDDYRKMIICYMKGEKIKLIQLTVQRKTDAVVVGETGRLKLKES